MKFTISIELGNAAFEGEDCGRELARILRKQADKLEGFASWDFPDQGGLWDVNGNKVGAWEVSEG